jgi:hypothetical protein
LKDLPYFQKLIHSKDMKFYQPLLHIGKGGIK